MASKGEVSFTENGVNFSPLSLETKDFSLNLNGNLPYSSMLPSLDFSVLLPDETEALKGFLTLKSDDTYDYSFVFTTFDDTSLLGKVFFQNGEITGNSTLTTLGIKRPFIFNLEAIPGENLAVKLYEQDKKDGYYVPEDQNLYSSYFFKQWDKNISILDKLKLHNKEINTYCGGGQACHIHLDEHLSKEQYKHNSTLYLY